MNWSNARYGATGSARKNPQVNNEEMLGEEEQSRSHLHHDPYLIPASPRFQALAASIFERLEATHPRPIRQRRDARERRKAITENLVASLAYVSLYGGSKGRLAISARNDPVTRYDRKGFSRELFMQIVSELEADSLLSRRKGTRNGQRTTIEPTAKFRALIDGLELSFGRADGAETIILKAKIERNRPKALVDYEDTPKTVAMREEVEAVNAALNASDLKLSNMPPPVPMFLTRRFQIDHPEAAHDFNQHGRLYGGFWINMAKGDRHLLRVNGEPVADLDFTGMFAQLAYIEACLPRPDSDPYDGIEGLPRDVVKMGLNALLCRTGPMLRLPSDLRQMVPAGWNAKRLSVAIAERHPRIAPLFGQGIGLRLMFTESQILMVALGELFAQGIPALPMHDGLMVPASREREARNAMARASLSIAGVALPVVRKDGR